MTVTDGIPESPAFGITLRGRYDGAAGGLAMDGALSPVYVLNGIAQVLTRPGEGMFGMTFRLGGAAAAPRVEFNPLSLLVPGFLREVLRPAVPGGAPAPAPAPAPVAVPTVTPGDPR